MLGFNEKNYRFNILSLPYMNYDKQSDNNMSTYKIFKSLLIVF